VTDRLDALADRLAPRVAERVVERIGDMLDERDAAPAPLLDATEAARFLGVDRSAVYAMAKDGRLPVVRLGDSDRPRLRFDRRALIEHLAVAPPESGPSNGRRRRRPRPGSTELLPVKGTKP
jgi:excisionase family DNA binding protein